MENKGYKFPKGLEVTKYSTYSDNILCNILNDEKFLDSLLQGENQINLEPFFVLHIYQFQKKKLIPFKKFPFSVKQLMTNDIVLEFKTKITELIENTNIDLNNLIYIVLILRIIILKSLKKN